MFSLKTQNLDHSFYIKPLANVQKTDFFLSGLQLNVKKLDILNPDVLVVWKPDRSGFQTSTVKPPNIDPTRN